MTLELLMEGDWSRKTEGEKVENLATFQST